jgi:hypothetical protein
MKEKANNMVLFDKVRDRTADQRHLGEPSSGGVRAPLSTPLRPSSLTILPVERRRPTTS